MLRLFLVLPFSLSSNFFFHPIGVWKVSGCVNGHGRVGYLRRLCHLGVAAWLWLAGSGPTRCSAARRVSLRIWYWGSERTCCGANPSDGRSGGSESQWGTFPWRHAVKMDHRGKRSNENKWNQVHKLVKEWDVTQAKTSGMRGEIWEKGKQLLVLLS